MSASLLSRRHTEKLHRRRPSLQAEKSNELDNVPKRPIQLVNPKYGKKKRDKSPIKNRKGNPKSNKTDEGVPTESWEPMTDEGLFFILTAANTLLCNDLGYSYKIASAT